ncbi:MAG: Rpn family recombination-promoting nuclease/putative transposase [Sphingobacteriales bacterium]|nr:MAG: Rpn family recombination-promoting nuclease/putative transposase [Sphingobacteriales bacterium]TAF78387.1 MAG: Rpn family recombination-promoting nuclease/putative transposase [Sphingobacteriales bacterium]
MKFVDVKNDIAFRKIFGNENKKEILISFLNAVLMLENDKKIISVDILTPYQLPDLKGGKVTIVDVKAKDQSNKNYIVEMQVAEVDGFDKRVLYYASKSYSSQIDRGDLYEKLNPIFFIGILDFEVTQNKDYISRHKIIDTQTSENFIKDIEFNFIELPKFNKQEIELTSVIDQWVYFIKNAEDLEVIPENVKDKGLKIAYEDAIKYNWTKEELDAYDYVLMREQDDRGVISLKVKKEIAKKFLSSGSSVELIALNTGLTIEQVKKLQAEK